MIPKHRINTILMKLTGKKLLKRNYQTVVIDLTLPEMEILHKADKHSVLKNIERSKKRGVIIKNITNDKAALYEYGQMLSESRMRLNIDTKTPDQFYADILNIVATKGKDYAVFMAYWNNNPIGSLGCVISNKRITEQGLARTVLNDEQKLYCVEALRWDLILYGKMLGCVEYDLGGISDTTAKEISISRNKLKWNGKTISLSRYV